MGIKQLHIVNKTLVSELLNICSSVKYWQMDYVYHMYAEFTISSVV